ncbi:hypothetical protein MTO96_016202 [Rhipicephalus appendiculatus]
MTKAKAVSMIHVWRSSSDEDNTAAVRQCQVCQEHQRVARPDCFPRNYQVLTSGANHGPDRDLQVQNGQARTLLNQARDQDQPDQENGQTQLNQARCQKERDHAEDQDQQVQKDQDQPDQEK